MRMIAAQSPVQIGPVREPEDARRVSLLDSRAVESMMEDFYRLTHVPMAIIDLNGRVVVRAGGQRVCLTYHRAHPDSCRNCTQSHTQPRTGVSSGETSIYKCRNHMWNVAAPITIGNQHVANLVSGQFFFCDEPVDEDLFKVQARRYGWDEAAYLESLREAPQLSREKAASVEAYLGKVARLLSELSYTGVELRTAAEARDALTLRLMQNEDRLNQITEQYLADKQLQRKRKMESIGLLAGGLAQDLNELLAGVLRNAVLAQGMLEQNHPATAVLNGIIRGSQEAAGLNRAMLSYAGKEHTVELFDVSAVVREMAALFRSSLSSKARLKLELADGLPLVKGDVSQIQQAVINLLINAAEAIGQNTGEISVTTKLEESGARPGEAARIRLEVTDTGSGVDPDTKARIFDPLFRAKAHRRGLGLAEVAEMLRGHNTKIQVDSALSRGTRFTVIFTAFTTEVEKGALAKSERADSGGTVLVVDNDKLVRDTATKALERFGFVVLTASSGREASEICRLSSQPIDVVLLEFSMPGLTGWETLPELVRLRPGLRVVLSSGFTEGDILGRCIGPEVHGFIQKPYSPKALTAQIHAAMCSRARPTG
jgi:polar amino acid transport system substrate-binding protein